MRSHQLVLSLLLCNAACAAGASPPPGGAGVDQPVPARDQIATSLGMAILSKDHKGIPRLVRAIAPRPRVAGLTASSAGRDHLAAISSLWVPNGLAMPLVDAGSQPLRNGATVVKLQQEIDGIAVHEGELRVLLHLDGSLAAVSGTLLPAAPVPRFASSPAGAAERALDQLYGARRPRPAIQDAGAQHGWHTLVVAADPVLRVTSARARRELVSLHGALVAAWAVEIEGNAPPDPRGDPSMVIPAARQYLIADAGGALLRDIDLISHDAFVYRTYADATGSRRPFDSAHSDVLPHPTGAPDGTLASPVAANLVVMESFHRQGDPWLPANATTTAGNNVEAFADRDGDGVFSLDDVRPEVRAGRVLNFRYDHELSPFDTPDQAKAAVVNAFYVANWMHDFWYDSGFTEITGNAQLDNFGRGGIGNDRLKIQTQYSAWFGLRDNAAMSTPADGGSPRMMVRLYTPVSQTQLTTPDGPVQSEAFIIGPRAFELSGELVAVTDGDPPLDDACQPITGDVADKIALVMFSGLCGSAETVDAVKAAGAIGVIVADATNDNPRPIVGSGWADLPGLAIGKSDGEALLAAIAAGPISVTLASTEPPVERDGALDNSVVAHEWAHYLHRRLAYCGASQCRAMSEGWGDFNGLLMSLRDNDDREGAYAHAEYVSSRRIANAAYWGNRRYPFSIDRTKNTLSFRHIADDHELPATPINPTDAPNSEIHNAGEVWATMLWEAFHILIDDHGLAVARRRIADYVVAGLLLTPANATFTEARDAILTAASALDTDDMLLMAAAFAGRGAGSCAVSPDNAAETNAGVVESGTLAAQLVVGDLQLTDDGVSCDHDGYLDPGESGRLRFSLANTGILDAEDVTITATSALPGIRLGAPIKIAAVPRFSASHLEIPVTVLPGAPRNRELAITIRAAGQMTCDPGGVTAALTTWIGVDEQPNMARIDRVDTQITPWVCHDPPAQPLWSVVREAGGNYSWFGRNAAYVSDTQLTSPVFEVSASEPFVVRLAHAYSFELNDFELFDGGVIEVSSDGGATWADVSAFGIDPGYTGWLTYASGNPLAGRLAFALASPGYPERLPLVLDFGTQLAGRSVQLRFRIGTDGFVGALGWDIDDIEASGITNTPFPARVAEAATCTARAAAHDVSRVVASSEAPATSLDAFDIEACIGDSW